MNLTVTDVEKFLLQFGLGHDEDISYSQFLAATLSGEQVTLADLRQLFSYLDTFETGVIDKAAILITF